MLTKRLVRHDWLKINWAALLVNVVHVCARAWHSRVTAHAAICHSVTFYYELGESVTDSRGFSCTSGMHRTLTKPVAVAVRRTHCPLCDYSKLRIGVGAQSCYSHE